MGGHGSSHEKSIKEMLEHIQKDGALSEIKDMWIKFDADHSGFLEKEEGRLFFSDLYDYLKENFDENVSQAKTGLNKEGTIQLWHNHFDTQPDGKISFDEFKEVLLRVLYSAGHHDITQKIVEEQCRVVIIHEDFGKAADTTAIISTLASTGIFARKISFGEFYLGNYNIKEELVIWHWTCKVGHRYKAAFSRFGNARVLAMGKTGIELLKLKEADIVSGTPAHSLGYRIDLGIPDFIFSHSERKKLLEHPFKVVDFSQIKSGEPLEIRVYDGKEKECTITATQLGEIIPQNLPRDTLEGIASIGEPHRNAWCVLRQGPYCLWAMEFGELSEIGKSFLGNICVYLLSLGPVPFNKL